MGTSILKVIDLYCLIIVLSIFRFLQFHVKIKSNKVPYLKKILLANKIDLGGERQVQSEEIKGFADMNQPFDVMEISVKNKQNINYITSMKKI